MKPSKQWTNKNCEWVHITPITLSPLSFCWKCFEKVRFLKVLRGRPITSPFFSVIFRRGGYRNDMIWFLQKCEVCEPLKLCPLKKWTNQNSETLKLWTWLKGSQIFDGLTVFRDTLFEELTVLGFTVLKDSQFYDFTVWGVHYLEGLTVLGVHTSQS